MAVEMMSAATIVLEYPAATSPISLSISPAAAGSRAMAHVTRKAGGHNTEASATTTLL